jgi:hypothetical protein
VNLKLAAYFLFRARCAIGVDNFYAARRYVDDAVRALKQ